MRWLEPEAPREQITRVAATQVLRAAIVKAPHQLALYERLGVALAGQGLYPQALEAFRKRADVEPEQFAAWGLLAQCHLRGDDPRAALEICERGERLGHGPSVARMRGDALAALGRRREAVDSYHAALEADPGDEYASEGLMRALSQEPDPEAMLAAADALPSLEKFRAERNALRAVGLSRLGRASEACALIDPERHVRTFRFQPPTAYGGADAFNTGLAAWIMAGYGAVPTPRPGCVIDYRLRHAREPMMQDLRAFARGALGGYLAELPALGLEAMTPLPAAAQLVDWAVFLRGEGRNGQHIHPRGYLSAVYYVQVPRAVREAEDRRGSLALGCCDKLTGHQGVWGVRYVKPEPGLLVVFPAHMFHDVVPTGSSEPRIAIGFDLSAAD